jgi:dolichyl-phosphate-mannose--protein O-mannosyl transferase/Gpi18-like mannosyltransferase
VKSGTKWALPVLLFFGLLLRLFFIKDAGFSTDVSTFEAWTISLLDHGLANFYGASGFTDYPPGYFYILAVVGHVWAPFRAGDAGFGLLAIMVKMPAILADIGVGALIYAIAKRFASDRMAILASACYVLNPAVIYISANWGQVDAIAGGLALLAAFFLLKSDDEVGTYSIYIPLAWVTLAYSLLIKPQAAIVAPIFIAFAFVNPEMRSKRVISTIIGLACAGLFTLLLVEPFHPSSPIAALLWLLQRDQIGSSVYPYNTVNAFNLWAIKGPFWQPDSQLIVGIPQYIWGLVLVIAALILIIWRYVTDRTPSGLLESCSLALIAFFILATRMHERYIFDGLLFSIACIPVARRYVWSTLTLTIVLFANLIYSLQYLAAVTGHTPGVDAANLWGWGTSIYSLLAVGTFFALGYVNLGRGEADMVAEEARAARRTQAKSFARKHFNPTEGLSQMGVIDYLSMGLLGVVNFVLSYVNYWYPPDKVFDEIYFARGAEEYLKNMRIYENTHPPLSKLLVTLSVMLSGGLNGGDNSHGWRFLDVVFGALVVMLLYVFAKRITGSTVFATLAAAFLTLDGMHFVQSRIATPEGFVVFFALAAIYAFYRFWIASQVEERRHVVVPPIFFPGAAAASIAFGLLVVGIVRVAWPPLNGATAAIIAVWAAMGAYLVVRYIAFPALFADGKTEQTFPDGSYALVDATNVVNTADGRTVSGTAAKIASLKYEDGDLNITYKTDPSVTYATPDGTAMYANNQIQADGARESGSSATLWLILFTVALGLLISTKWYGVMGFPVSFVVLILVWAQRKFTRGPALWGNPRGFRLDGALVTIAFVAATVYALAWVPDLVRHSPDQNEIHNVNDVVSRQHDMYEYHHNLKATHPYSSQWWEWPLDYVPIAYYYKDNRAPNTDSKLHDRECCVEEITSMPNPFIMWFGLIAVPLVGVLAWREKNKAYALIVLSYFLQWLPWMGSPRLVFAYHFYVNIPLICLSNAIVLQRIWKWAEKQDDMERLFGRIGVCAVVALIIFGFVYFYPVLAGVKIPWDAWHQRMWIDKWVVGPG